MQGMSQDKVSKELPLWNHQIEAIERAKNAYYFGLFFDVGTGKTRTMIEILKNVYAENFGIQDTIIVTPVITLENWKREIAIYSKIDPRNVIVPKGTGIQKLRQIQLSPPGKIIIVNYEALLNKDLLQSLLDRDPRVLVCDESHYVKNPTSKRTKSVHALANNCKYRYIMTGTPISNSAEDIFAQAYILDLGKRFERKFFYFKTLYFEDKNRLMPKAKYFPNWVIKPHALEAFNAKLREMTMYANKKQCLDLPPLILKEVSVELTKDQRKHYEEVKKHFLSYVGDEACVASIALTKALRMQEISSGYIKLENGEVVEFEENGKIKALAELLDNYTKDHKIIIWSVFKENHRQIAKLLEKKGIKFVSLTGDESQTQKVENIDAYERDPEIRVCIASQQVGVGFNMTSSSISIYYSANFNLLHDEQSEARNYRAGSEKHESIYRINLVAENTLDKLVFEALRDKKVLGHKIISDSLIK